MTTTAPLASPTRGDGRPSTPRDALRFPTPLTWPNVLYLVGWLLLATMVFHLVALAITGGAITGPVSLRKPATFAETGWLTAWSVALVLPALSTRQWQRHVIGTTVLLFGIGETTVMAVQAWRGVPSHYNFTTALDATLMRGGAGGLAFLFLIGMVVMLAASFRPTNAPRSLLVGVRLGVVVLLIGCVIGFVMISNMSGVFTGSFGTGFTGAQTGYVGPPPSVVGKEYLLLHPDTQGGDLVLLHAIGIHGLLLLTVPAHLLHRSRLPERSRMRVVAVMGTAVLGAMAVIAGQSFRSLPLGEMGPLNLGLLSAAAVALLAAYGVTARARLGRRWGDQAP